MRGDVEIRLYKALAFGAWWVAIAAAIVAALVGLAAGLLVAIIAPVLVLLVAFLLTGRRGR